LNLSQAVWAAPLANLKDRRHRKESSLAPLAPRAVEIVPQMQKGQVSRLVFPGLALVCSSGV
jgi:hypothetical protein